MCKFFLRPRASYMAFPLNQPELIYLIIILFLTYEMKVSYESQIPSKTLEKKNKLWNLNISKQSNQNFTL